MSPQPYTWLALYSNGGYLYQFDERGEEISSCKIDRASLAQFVFYGPYGPLVTLTPAKGDLFFYRRRTEMKTTGETLVAHLFGTSTDFTTGDASVFCVLQPENQWVVPAVEAFNGFRPKHQWWYPIEPVAEELQPVGK